ncbi:MAG: alpha amylase N-terminal ig-like domain-containing protein, partial [Lachnoclostridium sp.]|nr:alpha amylase N-terminal ig-like domain-containing protein [Lachnoclostridium sp.]
MKSTSINIQAIYSDGTNNFVEPPEPKASEDVRIRCRIGKEDEAKVFLVFSGQEILMSRSESDCLFDYYDATVSMGSDEFRYYFKIMTSTECVYYNYKGVVDTPDEYYHFKIIPGFQIPNWAKGAVFYQIYVDRFSDGDAGNGVENGEYSYIGEQVVRVSDWYKHPEPMGVREFYGGDLQGV